MTKSFVVDPEGVKVNTSLSMLIGCLRDHPRYQRIATIYVSLEKYLFTLRRPREPNVFEHTPRSYLVYTISWRCIPLQQ